MAEAKFQDTSQEATIYLWGNIWRSESKQAMGKDRLDIMGGRPKVTSDWRPAQVTWRMACLFKRSCDRPGATGSGQLPLQFKPQSSFLGVCQMPFFFLLRIPGKAVFSPEFLFPKISSASYTLCKLFPNHVGSELSTQTLFSFLKTFCS